MSLETVWVNETDAAVDALLGIISVRLPFTVTPGLTKMATLKEALTFLPPEIAELGLPLLKRNVKERPDCGYDVMFDVEGHFTPEEADGEEFSLDGTTDEAAIETHPDIEKLVTKYFPEGTSMEQAFNADGRIIFPITLTTAGPPLPNPLAGTTVYWVPKMLWTRTFVTPSFPEGKSRQLGCIGDPPVGRKGQRPPALQGKREWIMMQWRADWRGNVWKCVETWSVSPPGGATPDIYPYK